MRGEPALQLPLRDPARRHRTVSSVEELVGGAAARAPLTRSDGKSGALLERVIVGGHPLVLKHLSLDTDWVMRATGDLVCRPVHVWHTGLLDALPDCIDHATVGCAADPDRRVGALLMRDVSRWLVPQGHTRLPFDQHRRFLAHMAALHARFWGFEDNGDLLPLGNRYLLLSPWVTAAESERRDGHDIPWRAVPEGLRRLRRVSPESARVVEDLLRDPDPLLTVLGAMPTTLVHGDWKAGNLGSTPHGRTVLLDWTAVGAAPPGVDLAWYVAVNSRRLPEDKDAAIAAYRGNLEAAGVDTRGWWEPQVELCLLGAFVLLGWEKSREPHEMAWWAPRVARAAGRLR